MNRPIHGGTFKQTHFEAIAPHKPQHCYVEKYWLRDFDILVDR